MPDKPLSAPLLLTDNELNAIAMFNDTISAYPLDKTLHSIFEEQVLRTPDHTALQLGDQSLTYKELNDRSNQLARLIIEQGIKPGDQIGLLVVRSFDMITGMYAILKSGASYVPVDPDYPLDRQVYILSNSNINLLLTDSLQTPDQLVSELKILNIKETVLSGYESTNLNLAIDSRQLAYTIYTSGSTGKPKGVMIEHHSAINLILWVNNTFNIGEKDRLLFITSMCFDLSVYDIFGILACGGTLVIAEQAHVTDINQLQYMLQHFQITFWDSVPSTLDYLIKELELTDPNYRQHSLRVVFLSGDWIPVGLPDKIKHFFPSAQVVSLGGATEATVWSNYFIVEKTLPEWKQRSLRQTDNE